MRIAAGIVLFVVLYIVLFKVIQIANEEFLHFETPMTTTTEGIVIGIVGIVSLAVTLLTLRKFKKATA